MAAFAAFVVGGTAGLANVQRSCDQPTIRIPSVGGKLRLVNAVRPSFVIDKTARAEFRNRQEAGSLKVSRRPLAGPPGTYA